MLRKGFGTMSLKRLAACICTFLMAVYVPFATAAFISDVKTDGDEFARYCYPPMLLRIMTIGPRPRPFWGVILHGPCTSIPKGSERTISLPQPRGTFWMYSRMRSTRVLFWWVMEATTLGEPLMVVLKMKRSRPWTGGSRRSGGSGFS